MRDEQLELLGKMRKSLSTNSVTLNEYLSASSTAIETHVIAIEEERNALKEALFQVFNSEALSQSDISEIDLYVLPLAVLHIWKQSLSDTAKESLSRYKKAFINADKEKQEFLLKRYNGLDKFIAEFEIK